MECDVEWFQRMSEDVDHAGSGILGAENAGL